MSVATQLKELDVFFQKQVVADRAARMNVGHTILSRDGSIKGTVTGVSSRYCAGCSQHYPCYLVTWEDGKKTRPCVAGVKEVGHFLQIQ